MGQIAAMLPVDEGELEERQRQWARACMEIDAQASEHERKRALVLVWEGLLRDGVDSLLRQIADHVCKARDDVSALVKDVIIGGLIGQATDDVSRAYDVVVDLHADGRRRGRRRFRHGNVVTRADVFEAKRDAERGAHDRRRTLLGRLRARPDASKNQKRRRKVVAVDGPVDDATERKEIDEDEGVVVVDVDGFAGQPPTGSFEEAYCKAWHAALTTVHGQAGGYVAVRGDASGRFVLGAGTDGSLEVAEVATGHTHRQLPGIGHSRRWKLMASGPWSRLLSAATATTKGTVALWDVAVGEPGASSVAPRVPRRVDEISFVDLVSKKPDPPKRNMSDEVASAFVVIDPPHPVPSAIAVHRAVTFNLDTPSVVVGMDNGDLVRWNTSNATAQMLTGRSAASREPGPVSAPGGGFVRREFHHGHRSSICMMDFLADTDLVSADKDGYVIVWRTDRLSGFDWFQPRRRFHVSVAETYFDDDRSRPAQQLFPPAGVPIDLLNGAAYEDALRRRLVTAGYRSWRSRSPDTLYPQAGDGECWTHAFRRDQGRLIAHERRPVRCRQRRASLIGAQMTPTGTDLVILSWFPKDTVGNRASRASFHVGSIDGKAQDSEERFRHVADIAVADDLESATGAQIAVWRISNVFDPPGTDFIFVLTVVSPTFVSVISLSTGATVMKIALPGSSQGRTPSDLAVFSGSHSIAVCYATSRAIDTWTIEDRNDEEHRRQYTLRMRLQSQRLQAAPVEQRVRVSSTEWGFGYVDFDVPNTRFDAQAKLRELVKTLVDHAVMGHEAAVTESEG
ncbi:Uncharacterized protein PBTT_01338 [Plasmodiophora brassicae]|uniref:Uncharacterized protein n=1 Tax=Plasmodiophora brassicae TaxID=37360 RepID=A0A0G4IZ50_PLABS|nr:hypothetical protein PBRA_001453 [Plasmodiophora brassicae]